MADHTFLLKKKPTEIRKLDNMGQPIKKEDLERIGINYDFEKKTYSISLFYRKKSRSRTKTDARYAKNIQKPRPHMNEE